MGAAEAAPFSFNPPGSQTIAPVNTGMTKPWQQGHFDGLCGIYSLINSVHVLARGMNEERCTDLFQFLVEAGGDQFPKALYDGLDFEPLYDIAEKMRSHLADRVALSLDRPFDSHDVVSADQYLDLLARELSGRKAVAIIGLGQPWDHWTVVTKVMPHAVRFADSYGIKQFNRSIFSLVEDPKRIKIDFRETIVVARI